MAGLDEREYKHLFVDAIDPEAYVVVHYRLQPAEGDTMAATAARLAILTSLGSLEPLPYESKERRLEYAARVLSAEDDGRVTLAFPLELIGEREGLTPLFTVLFYGASFNYVKELFIEKIDFPRQFINRFAGPRFGVDGFRTALGVFGRSPIGVILKPRLGVSLDTMAKQAKECLLGGVDFVVDDELMLDRTGDLSFARRVEKLMGIVTEASRSTGERKTYVANIASTPFKALRFAQIAHDNGVGGVLVNAFTMGFPTVAELTETLDGLMPILIHNMGVGILTRPLHSPDPRRPTGVSDALIAKLSRLVGGDAIHAGISSSAWYHNDAWGTPIIAIRSPLHSLRPSLAVAAGGLNVGNLWDNIRSLGPDVVLEAGTGLLGYPGGPRQAATAFRRLVNALRSDMKDDDARETIAKIAAKDTVLERELDRSAFGWRKDTRRGELK